VGTPLKQLILQEARRLGFVLAGVTTPEPPPHLSAFEAWLAQNRHASMDYLATDHARQRRADPRLILPECKSILILATPYSRTAAQSTDSRPRAERGSEVRGKIASYAWGDDYHLVLPERLQSLIHFIETEVGHTVANRWYTDTGPILERDLAQRAGLGWIGKNTCLIHPRHGSYFLLAEIFLDLDLEPDPPFTTDHCGTCTRCIDACPTDCILPDRTIDAGRCISYLTIELKDGIPEELRPLMGDWVFGCDICQAVCPWNRFAAREGDPAFTGDSTGREPPLILELQVTPAEFNRKFKNSPIRRAKPRGFLRNVAVALGNNGGPENIPALDDLLNDPDPMLREHAAWATNEIAKRSQ
jgi:epoxyqueuosine reductase